MLKRGLYRFGNTLIGDNRFDLLVLGDSRVLIRGGEKRFKIGSHDAAFCATTPAY